ncbi:MAG: hypothetical protein PHV37_02165 [Candidatus Gastranaerophilales bacterium]|nr:hypothetical protein [Candidatus Gastranaerophilales bacterium]
MIISNKIAMDTIRKIGRTINAPEQRVIIGVSALLTQPVIDLTNPRADKDTKVLSASRSLGKIIAGTTSGYCVRQFCTSELSRLVQKDNVLDPTKIKERLTKIIKQMQKDNVNPKKIESYQKVLAKMTDTLDKVHLENFKKNLGSIAAIGVMLFTNFLWDAPVTKTLTNKFYNYATGKKAENANSSN